MSIKSKIHSHFIYYRSAVLVLMWDALMYAYVDFSRYSSVSSFHAGIPQLSNAATFILLDNCYYIFFFLFPLFGLLADVWIGKYKCITFGIVTCFLSFLLYGVGYILTQTSNLTSLLWIFYVFGYFFEIAGYAAFRSSIIQYNIDQLVGASADELSTIIFWHAGSIPIVFTILQLCRSLMLHSTMVIVSLIISGVAVSCVLTTHSLLNQWLENVSLIDNPIKLIIRVLNYARKHKYPENRSALTYWEEESPSRLDLGKEKYGGPFTEEEVEDVKTVFRMLPLFIGITGYACTDEVYWNIFSGQLTNNSTFISSIISSNFLKFATPLTLMVTQKFFWCCCFYKFRHYKISMLKKMVIGLIFSIATMVSCIVIFKCSKSILNSEKYYNDSLVIPQVLFGIAFVFFYPTSIEFTIAQCPVQMRGLMIGMWYFFTGIGYSININLKYFFKPCTNEYICFKYHYYLAKSGLVFVILLVFFILALRYKFRIRENEVNIHQIVDDHYIKYMRQEEQHRIDKKRGCFL